jgi:hypothetical protein
MREDQLIGNEQIYKTPLGFKVFSFSLNHIQSFLKQGFHRGALTVTSYLWIMRLLEQIKNPWPWMELFWRKIPSLSITSPHSFYPNKSLTSLWIGREALRPIFVFRVAKKWWNGNDRIFRGAISYRTHSYRNLECTTMLWMRVSETRVLLHPTRCGRINYIVLVGTAIRFASFYR